MPSPKTLRIAFAGGGSGGHLYPQIAVAREILKARPNTEIYFVSTKASIEERLIPQNGFSVLLVSSGKLKGQNIFSLFKTFYALFISFFQCLKIVLTRRPHLIFSAGGYAGAPFLVVGSLLGVRCEILEQNRIPGLANRLMSKFCKKVYVNFTASKSAFPSKEVAIVGHPCRPEIEAARWKQDESKAKIDANPFRIFVFGGSQGALGINRLVTAAVKHLNGFNIEIHHQTGEADFDRVKKEYEEAGFGKVKVEKYITDMAASYQNAHLVICRAGASSLAELAAAGKAAFLIPLVSKDRHQEFNAAEIEKNGAGIMRLQKDLTGESVAEIIKGLYSDRSKIYLLSQNSASLHQEGAANRIAQSVIQSLE